MSLNTSHADGGVLIFAGERILIYYDGIKFDVDPDESNPTMKGTKKGRCYLTTHRVIFNNTDRNEALQSFSIPFLCMRQVELEQPVFGANYIKGKVIAEEKANWTGKANFKMYFTNGGAIEFGQAMLEAGRRANKNRQSFAAPPPYSPPPNGYFMASPPDYTPMPNENTYAFVPYQTFPNAPPADSVYMMQAPPPYPGVINPTPGQYGYPQNGYPQNNYPQTNPTAPAFTNEAPPYPANGAPAYPVNGAPAYPVNGAPAYPANGASPYPTNGAPYPPANGSQYPPANGAPPYPYGGPPYGQMPPAYPNEKPPPYSQ